MHGEAELDKVLHDHRLYKPSLSRRIKAFLNVQCVDNLAQITEEQIDNIPSGPDGLLDWKKLRLIQLLRDLRVRCALGTGIRNDYNMPRTTNTRSDYVVHNALATSVPYQMPEGSSLEEKYRRLLINFETLEEKKLGMKREVLCKLLTIQEANEELNRHYEDIKLTLGEMQIYLSAA